MDNEETRNEKFEELCAAYVLNALDKNDREEFEQLLIEANEEQRQLYRQLSSTARQLAFTVEENEPSELLGERLLARVRTNTGEMVKEEEVEDELIDVRAATSGASPEEGSSINWTSFPAVAAFALLIVSLSLLFYSFNLSSQVNDRESFIEDQQIAIKELEGELQQTESMFSVLESRDVELVLMAGLEVNPDGFGKVIWDAENGRALLQVANLPPVSSDKNYQLWIIRDNEPISAGVFAITDSTDRFFHIDEIAADEPRSSDAFAVTMEPKGGMPQPTGDMYLLGHMNGDQEY